MLSKDLTNLSAHLSHLQTCSGKNFCQDAFIKAYEMPTILLPLITVIQKHGSVQHLEHFIYSARCSAKLGQKL